LFWKYRAAVPDQCIELFYIMIHGGKFQIIIGAGAFN
jgi:hypothetical protein